MVLCSHALGGADRALVMAVFVASALIGAAATAQDDPGEVLQRRKLSALLGGFAGTLENNDNFGASVASLGDLDGDGIGDLAVGAPRDDNGGNPPGPLAQTGAVWILFLNPSGTVKTHRKISATQGGFGGELTNDGLFGSSVAALSDLDGDFVTDLAVGAPQSAGGGIGRGAVWILFLNPDGTVKSEQKIDDTAGGFGGILDDFDLFGFDVSNLGDFDGDGQDDLAVGAPLDDDGGPNRGAVWLLLLKTDGTVKATTKVSGGFGLLVAQLDDADAFAFSVGGLDDFDGDGVRDLLVGAPHDDDGGLSRGAVYLLLMNANGSIKQLRKISQLTPSFSGLLPDGGQFGSSVDRLSDQNGDGVVDIVVGAFADPGAGTGQGAVWTLMLDANGGVVDQVKITSFSGGFTGSLDDGDALGFGCASLGDFDGDGFADIAVGALGDDDGGDDRGAVWLMFLAGELPVPTQWMDLGFALGGQQGQPVLTGVGDLLGNDPVLITLTNARINTTAFLVLGLSAIMTPFKGGTFVPAPDLVTPLPTGVAGTIPINSTWPPGLPSGLMIWLQYWIQDVAGPAGFAASNAVKATTP